MTTQRHRIELKPSAAKSLDRLPVDLQKRIIRETEKLAGDRDTGRETELKAPSSTNDKTPVWQGFDADCEPVRTAVNQEPPLRLELRTYALRKRRSTN